MACCASWRPDEARHALQLLQAIVFGGKNLGQNSAKYFAAVGRQIVNVIFSKRFLWQRTGICGRAFPVTVDLGWQPITSRTDFQLNKMSIRLDDRGNEVTFFQVDAGIIRPSMLISPWSPCFVLDARLQSGLSTCPKRERWSRLRIYVGHSPAHAGT